MERSTEEKRHQEKRHCSVPFPVSLKEHISDSLRGALAELMARHPAGRV